MPRPSILLLPPPLPEAASNTRLDVIKRKSLFHMRGLPNAQFQCDFLKSCALVSANYAGADEFVDPRSLEGRKST